MERNTGPRATRPPAGGQFPPELDGLDGIEGNG